MNDAPLSIHNSVSPLLANRVDDLLARIDRALKTSGRSFDDVTILLATKTRTAAEIRAAIDAFEQRGITVAVGENRAQEMAKHAELDDLHAHGITRHFIGRIQTNKARDIVRFADLIHSVDRESVIHALAQRAASEGITQRILLQVNTSGEESKGGFEATTAALAEALDQCADAGYLSVEGLMTIGSHTTDQAEIRRSLRALRELRDSLANEHVRELSMGMSNDLDIAIEEGATYVRVGSAIFGERSYA